MKLTEKEIKQLIQIHKEIKRKDTPTNTDKIKCIIYYGKGWTRKEIQDALFISENTIDNYINLYKNKGISGVLSKNYKCNNYKLTLEQEKLFIEHIENNIVLTASEACNYVLKSFGVKFSTNGMTQTLKRLGFTYKKPKKYPAKLDPIKQKEFTEYYDSLSSNLRIDQAIWFCDASGFEHNARIERGWFKKGKDIYVKSNTGRRKLNVNGAYNPTNHKCITDIYENTTNSKSNIDLIKKILLKNPEIKEHFLIFDRASYNYSKLVKGFTKEIETKKGIKINLIYLPSYSPNLNLIERLWRYSKRNLLSNMYYSTYIEFKRALKSFFSYKLQYRKNDLQKLMMEDFQKYPSFPQI